MEAELKNQVQINEFGNNEFRNTEIFKSYESYKDKHIDKFSSLINGIEFYLKKIAAPATIVIFATIIIRHDNNDNNDNIEITTDKLIERVKWTNRQHHP